MTGYKLATYERTFAVGFGLFFRWAARWICPRFPVHALDMSRSETAEHRIGDSRSDIYEPRPRTFAAAYRIRGRCNQTDATGAPHENNLQLRAQTSATNDFNWRPDLLLGKTWLSQPLLSESGQPVMARVLESVYLLPKRRFTEAHVPFPEIHELEIRMRITLNRIRLLRDVF